MSRVAEIAIATVAKLSAPETASGKRPDGACRVADRPCKGASRKRSRPRCGRPGPDGPDAAGEGVLFQV
jgi:hypothetical protein